MIKFSLKCANNHRFESWFGSNSDFDRLKNRRLVNCVVCGSSDVSKAVMAPRISPDKSKPLSEPSTAAEQTVREMRKKIEAESDDVGINFATEARRIHDGEAPRRAIIGEAKLEDARDLIEDGVPVVPLPWSPKRTN